MANGNYYGHPANTKYTGKLEIYENNNIAANNTTITWYFKVYRNDSYSSTYSRSSGNRVVVVMNGVTVCDTTDCGTVCAPNGEAAAYTLASGTTVIGHNGDGSKSFAFSATYTNSKSDSISPLTVSGTHTCNTIPRASSVSLMNFTLGSPGVIAISAASSSFRHTLLYSFGGLSGTVATNVGSTYSFTPPKSWGNQIPNSLSGSGTFTCITYNGTAEIGRSSCPFTVTVSSDMVPSFSGIGVERVNGSVPSSWGIYVQGKSQAKLTINGAAGSYGSTIKGYSITGGGFSSGSSSFTTGYLGSGTITFSAYVTDSRGKKSAVKTVSISVVPYSNPSISSVSTYRCDSDGSRMDDGSYFRGFARLSVASCGSKNSLACVVKYRKTGASSWVTAGSLSDNVAGVFGDGLMEAEASYDVRYELSDAFSTVTYQSYVSTAFFLMHFKRGGRGIAIGKTAEEENLFDCALPLRMGDGIVSSGAFNRGGANSQTKGALTQVLDATGTFHSVIVGRDASGARKYGVDLKDVASGDVTEMRLYSGTTNFNIQGNSMVATNATLINSSSTFPMRLTHTGAQAIQFENCGSTKKSIQIGSNGTDSSYCAYLYDASAGSYIWRYDANGYFRIISMVNEYIKFAYGNGISWGNDGGIWSTQHQMLYFAASGENNFRLWLGVWENGWRFAPNTPHVTLGSPAYKWEQIYCVSSAISTSDRAEKKDIETLDGERMERFIDALDAVSYKFIDGNSGRTHTGMVAQQVEEAMAAADLTDMDFAGFIKSPKYNKVEKEDGTTESVLVEGEYTYGLRYEEFIAPIISVVQRQRKEMDDLKERLAKLERRLEELVS